MSSTEATMRSKVDIHARGIEITNQLAGLIDARQAVERASERIRSVAMAYVANGTGGLHLGRDS
jgi:hypothetical protein